MPLYHIKAVPHRLGTFHSSAASRLEFADYFFVSYVVVEEHRNGSSPNSQGNPGLRPGKMSLFLVKKSTRSSDFFLRFLDFASVTFVIVRTYVRRREEHRNPRT